MCATFPAGVMEMCGIPGLVGEALLFSPPAQFFSHITTRCGAATGLPQAFPGSSGNSQKCGGCENVNAFVDVIGGLGESKKAVLLGSPLQRFRHGCPGKRYAVVVHEEHDIGPGLL